MKNINIGILAHVDAGKTTLTEQLLFCAGAIRQAGDVNTGTARTDYLQVERERGISVRSSAVSFSYGGMQINIIDTPGHADFAAEVERSLAVLDAAILIVSAVEGIQPRTELLIDALIATKTAMMVVINKTDRQGSNVSRVLQELRDRWGIRPALLSHMEGEGSREVMIRSVTAADTVFHELMELCCDLDDALLLRYLDDKEIKEEEWWDRLYTAIRQREAVPVLYTNASQGKGIKELLALIKADILPLKNREDNQLSAVVYQISHDKDMGRIAHVRMFGGSLKSRDTVVLPNQTQQKITQIRRYQGERYRDVGIVSSGEIAALCGLSSAKVGDIIGEACPYTAVHLAAPLFRVSAEPIDQKERTALLSALNELAAEEPLLDVQYVTGEQEIDLSVTGTIQLEILTAILRERFGLSVRFSSPTVIYKEKPIKMGIGKDAYTMPKPCWAIVELAVSPLKDGSGITFSSRVPNDQIFYRYQRHVEQAVHRAAKQGIYNWEAVDFHVELIGGSHHTVHTHPLDFFLATPLALYKAFENAGMMLLEPMELARISVPEEYAGRIISDLTSMRAVYDVPVIQNGIFMAEARIPVSEAIDYGVRLASETAGRGAISVRFDGYAPCPEGIGKAAKRRGPDPRDRDRYILTMRNAITL